MYTPREGYRLLAQVRHGVVPCDTEIRNLEDRNPLQADLVRAAQEAGDEGGEADPDKVDHLVEFLCDYFELPDEGAVSSDDASCG